MDHMTQFNYVMLFKQCVMLCVVELCTLGGELGRFRICHGHPVACGECTVAQPSRATPASSGAG